LRFSLNKVEKKEHAVPDVIPLEMLGSGQWADVADVSGEPDWVVRMAELGVRVGSRIKLLQPGSPCLLQVGPARLSLRGDSLLQVLVQPVHAAG
jgi:Fe2+ transport system protein FeoA